MPLSRGEVHVDAVLTNLSRTFKFPDLIADEVSPRVKVKKDSDVYYTFGREEIRLKGDGEGDRKNACSPAVAFDWRPTGTEAYVCVTRALKDSVCDRTVKNADSPVRPMRRTVEKLTRNLLMHRERRIAKLFTASPLITSTSTPAIKWDTPTADIEDDIRAAKEDFRLACGAYPSHIIMSATVWGFVKLFIKASAEVSIMERSSDLPLNKLWGMQVVISEAMFNSAAEGAAESVADVWPDTVTLVWVNPSKRPSLEDSSFSWSFTSRDFVVRRWRDEEIEATMLEVQMCVDEKVVAPFAAHTITDVLT